MVHGFMEVYNSKHLNFGWGQELNSFLYFLQFKDNNTYQLEFSQMYDLQIVR